MKILPVGAEFIPWGRTDKQMTKVIVAFRTFAKAHKIVPVKWVLSAHGLAYCGTEQRYCTNLNCGFCVLSGEQCASISDSDVWFLTLCIIQYYFIALNLDVNRLIINSYTLFANPIFFVHGIVLDFFWNCKALFLLLFTLFFTFTSHCLNCYQTIKLYATNLMQVITMC